MTQALRVLAHLHQCDDDRRRFPSQHMMQVDRCHPQIVEEISTHTLRAIGTFASKGAQPARSHYENQQQRQDLNRSICS
jgi:hypothetical protein